MQSGTQQIWHFGAVALPTERGRAAPASGAFQGGVHNATTACRVGAHGTWRHGDRLAPVALEEARATRRRCDRQTADRTGTPDGRVAAGAAGRVLAAITLARAMRNGEKPRHAYRCWCGHWAPGREPSKAPACGAIPCAAEHSMSSAAFWRPSRRSGMHAPRRQEFVAGPDIARGRRGNGVQPAAERAAHCTPHDGGIVWTGRLAPSRSSLLPGGSRRRPRPSVVRRHRPVGGADGCPTASGIAPAHDLPSVRTHRRGGSSTRRAAVLERFDEASWRPGLAGVNGARSALV
jgi:hypothetical protein